MEIDIQKELNALIKKECSLEEARGTYLHWLKQYTMQLNEEEFYKECISGYNRMVRNHYWSCNELSIEIHTGDICYIDFGHAYLNEAGFQHFGLVLALNNYKAFVVPMTSNAQAVRLSREQMKKDHLFYLGKITGLNKASVLFINDCRFINTSRVISVSAYLCPEQRLFKEIQKKVFDGIFKNKE